MGDDLRLATVDVVDHQEHSPVARDLLEGAADVFEDQVARPEPLRLLEELSDPFGHLPDGLQRSFRQRQEVARDQSARAPSQADRTALADQAQNGLETTVGLKSAA